MPKPDDPLPSLESLSIKIDTAKSRTDKEKNGETSASSRRQLSKIAGLAGGLAAGAAVGGTCGYMIDRWLATSPIGLISGFFLGFAAGFYNLIKEAAKDNVEKE